METAGQDIWFLFCFVFGITLAIAFVMRILSTYFYTKDVVIKKFTILDIEIAASPKELVNLINGLYALPADYSKKAVRALRARMYLDFIFMPFAYGSIFLLCMRVLEKMQSALGINTFGILAFLQIISWLFDIIENIYILRKIHPAPVASSQRVHTWYLYMEAVKWGIILIGVVSCFASIAYFWLTGDYSHYSIVSVSIIFAEIIVFLVLGRFIKAKSPNAPPEPVK